ncbi:MAG: hypothetical protein ACE5GO_02665 [Anaerolineales bacterium]
MYRKVVLFIFAAFLTLGALTTEPFGPPAIEDCVSTQQCYSGG